MRRSYFAAALVWLCSGVAEAKDVSLVLGFKGWLNSWTTTTSVYVPQQGVNVPSFTSDPYFAAIPNLTLRVKRVFLSGSLMSSPDITFPKWTDTIKISGTPYTLVQEYSAKRKEVDANLGYYLVYPSVAVTAGYKGITQEFRVKSSGTGLISTDTESDTEMSGPTFGISGSATIGESPFSIYGNFSQGFLDIEYKPSAPGTPTDDGNYQSSEVGLAWVLGPNGSLTLGYKLQRILTSINNPDYKKLGLEGTDYTSGLILGLNLVF